MASNANEILTHLKTAEDALNKAYDLLDKDRLDLEDYDRLPPPPEEPQLPTEEEKAEYQAALAEYDRMAAAAKQPRIEDAARLWRRANLQHDLVDKARKRMDGLLEQFSRYIIPEMMTTARRGSFVLSDLKVRIQMGTRWTATCVDKPECYKWLKENGAEALVYETVNAQALASFAKQRMEDDGKDLPLCFKVGTMNTTSAVKVG